MGTKPHYTFPQQHFTYKIENKKNHPLLKTKLSQQNKLNFRQNN